MWYGVYGFWLLLIVTALVALNLGSQSERRVATAYLIASVATFLLRTPGGSRYAALDVGVLGIDLTLMVFLLWMTAKSPRWWLVVSAALQLVTVLGHLAMLDGPSTRPFDYFMTTVSSSYPAILLLAFAVIRTARSRMRNAPNSTVY